MAKKDYQKIINLWDPVLSDTRNGIEIVLTGDKTSGTRSVVTITVDEWHIERIMEQYVKILKARHNYTYRLLETIKQKAIPQ